METSVYEINKGINKSIEFRGLKAQYIWYLGGGVVALMILFACMYLIGLPSILCVVLIGILGTGLVIKIYSMSKKYGEHGLMKAIAKKQIPRLVKINERQFFIKLKQNK